MKNIRQKIILFLLYLSAVLYSINYTYGMMRLLDVFSIVIMFLAIPYIKVKKKNFIIVFIFFMTLFLSIGNGTFMSNNEVIYERAVFLYKYSYPFIFIAILYNLKLNIKQTTTLLNYMFIGYVFLVVWVFLYVYLVSNNIIIGSFRPSFPFSNDYWTSDAHLYSSSLGIGLVYFSVLFKNLFVPKYLFFPFLFVAFAALVLTGSRSGLAIYIIGIILYNLIYIKGFFKLIFFMLIIIIIIILFSPNIDLTDDYIRLIERASNFDLEDDGSSLNRIVKMNIGINDAENMYYLLGIGIFKSSLVWYDSLIGILMAHTGMLGFLSFLVVLIFFILNNNKYKKYDNKNYYALFVIILFTYLVANFITEFFLVSRSVFPVLIYLFILHQYMKLEYQKNIKERSYHDEKNGIVA